MKNKLFVIIVFILCLTLMGCSFIPEEKSEDKKSKYDVYVLSDNMTEEKIDECMRYIKSVNPTREFCKGNERLHFGNDDFTFKEAIDHDVFKQSQLDYLVSYGVLSHYYIPPIIYEFFEWIYPIFKSIRF